MALTGTMNDNEDLTNRLHDLGQQPVDPAVAARHLSAMSQLPARRMLTQRLRIVGAFAVGLLVGTTGLATAGALPDGVQEVAHDTLGKVGLDVPRGDRYQGAECGGEVKNHGQYVRSQPKENRAEAAASRCGKPVQAGTDNDKADGNGCGKPPWAGRGKPTQAEKDARKTACVPDAGDADQGSDKDAGPAGGEAPAVAGVPDDEASTTTTTVPPTTTTTAPPTTPTTAPPTTTTTLGDTTTTTADPTPDGAP